MKYIENVLEFELFDIGGFSISVYNLLLVVVIIFTVKGITHSLDLLVKKRLEKKGLSDEGRSNSITQIIKYIIYIIGFFTIVQSLGINVDLILGVFAALGLGIGFALQDVFKDLISGIIILFEGNVSVGDILEVDGLIGTVKQIKLRTSLIRTRDGIFIVVPNNRVVNERVINWSTNTKITRFNISVGVAYGSDVTVVKDLLLKSVENNAKVSNRPNSVVFFNDFGDSALMFELHFWVTDTWSIEVIRSDLRFEIDRLFRENDIRIPFPQRDVHMIQK
jgi:small-conductance mechanosensitive channel